MAFSQILLRVAKFIYLISNISHRDAFNNSKLHERREWFAGKGGRTERLEDNNSYKAFMGERLMGLPRDKVSYHGTVNKVDEALKMADAFPARGMSGEGGNSLHFNIEMGIECLNIYPPSEQEVKPVSVPNEGLEYISCNSESVSFMVKEGNRYQVYYNAKEGGFR